MLSLEMVYFIKNKKKKKSILIFVLKIDVCNGHPGTDHMTTPQEFYVNVMGALKLLDQWVAPESHVVFVGLVDGRILYNTVGERIHPIGSLNNDVKYKDFYDFLNCLQVNLICFCSYYLLFHVDIALLGMDEFQ